MKCNQLPWYESLTGVYAHMNFEHFFSLELFRAKVAVELWFRVVDPSNVLLQGHRPSELLLAQPARQLELLVFVLPLVDVQLPLLAVLLPTV